MQEHNEEQEPSGAILDVCVLYVEDDDSTRSLVEAMLKRVVSRVITAPNGLEGLNIYHNAKKIDIVLADLEMPVMDGLAMIKDIRYSNDDIPIVVISAHDDKDHLLKVIDLRIDMFITKPLSMAKLVKTLRRFFKE